MLKCNGADMDTNNWNDFSDILLVLLRLKLGQIKDISSF